MRYSNSRPSSRATAQPPGGDPPPPAPPPAGGAPAPESAAAAAIACEARPIRAGPLAGRGPGAVVGRASRARAPRPPAGEESGEGGSSRGRAPPRDRRVRQPMGAAHAVGLLLPANGEPRRRAPARRAASRDVGRLGRRGKTGVEYGARSGAGARGARAGTKVKAGAGGHPRAGVAIATAAGAVPGPMPVPAAFEAPSRRQAAQTLRAVPANPPRSAWSPPPSILTQT